MNEEFVKEQEIQEQENPNESKSEKFMRLAPPRVDKILNGIASLKKLSVKGSYEYTPEQTEKIFSAIKNALDDCEEAFKPKEKTTSGFSF